MAAAAVAVGGVLIGKTDKPAFITFHDAGSGVSMTYPGSWTVLKGPDPQVRLIADSGGLAGIDSLQIRVQQTQGEVGSTGSTITDLKSVTDAIVSGSATVVVLQNLVTINGLPGYYYLYKNTDPTTGQALVHAHYFLFHGHEMISVVFQSGVTDFAKLAPIFDKMRASIHVTP